jgi:hypothetical protein
VNEKVAATIHKIENKGVGTRRTDHAPLFYQLELPLNTPTSGDRPVGIVRLRMMFFQ